MPRFLAAIFLISIIACSKNTSRGPHRDYSYFYETNSNVDTVNGNGLSLINIIPGNKLVFSYLMMEDEAAGISDASYSELLVFEVDAAATSFSYSTDDFEAARVLYQPICYCADVSARLPVSGKITGTKTATDEWQIESSLDVERPDLLKIAHKFKRKL